MLLRATLEREEKHSSSMAVVLLNFVCLNILTLFCSQLAETQKQLTHTQKNVDHENVILH